MLGVKYLERVLPLLKRLHLAGCARDQAGIRDLHKDQYCALILLFMFSPVVDSLRCRHLLSDKPEGLRIQGWPRSTPWIARKKKRNAKNVISELSCGDDPQEHRGILN